jgi:hypothetical protein
MTFDDKLFVWTIVITFVIQVVGVLTGAYAPWLGTSWMVAVLTGRLLWKAMRRKPIKPRIRLERGFTASHWVCRIDGERWAGYGLSPKMAYGCWNTKYRRST